MGFTVPNAVELEVLQDLLSTAWTIRLYGNNKTPAGGDTASAYTEIAGGGYAAKVLAAGNWTISDVSGVQQGIYSDTQIWTFTGVIDAPGTIYGYYITRNTDGKLMAAERFSSILVPFSPVAGSQIRVLPRYSVASQF